MMRKIFVLLAVFSVMSGLAGASQAALIGLGGTEVTELYSSAGTFTTIGGLDLSSGQLYFGQFKEIKSLDPISLAAATVGNVPSNAGNAIVIAEPNSGTIYTAYGTSYSAPFPHAMGFIDSEENFALQVNLDGAYDAAVNSSGDLYITANPGNLGTQVLRYDWTDGSLEAILDIGGASCGLTFDADDNLYVADGLNEKVLTFRAADIAGATTPLTASDAIASIDLASPGFLAIDSEKGYLYASYLDASWDTHVDRIRLADPTDRVTIVDGGGKMVLNDAGDLYMLDTDWGTYSSTVNLVSVPEPSVIALLLLGLTSLVMIRRR